MKAHSTTSTVACVSLALFPLALGFTGPARWSPAASTASSAAGAAHRFAVPQPRGVDEVAEEGTAMDRRGFVLQTAALSAAAAAALAPTGAFASDDPNDFFSRMERGSSEGNNRGVAPPSSVRNKDDGRVFATLTPPFQAGYAVQVAFVSPWKEKKSSVMNFGDTAKTQDAFVALSPLDKKAGGDKDSIEAVPQDVVLEALLGKDTRFGTYGSAGNIKVRGDATSSGPDGSPLRLLDVSFTSQGAQLEVDKRVAVAARLVKPTNAGGVTTLALLIAGTSKAKWADSEADVKQMTSTFVAKATAPKEIESWL